MDKVLDIISRIVCIILCFVLFFIILGYLSFNIFTKVVNTSNVTIFVSSMDSRKVLGEEVINSLYEDVDKNGIDRSIVDGLVESKEFKELIGRVFGNSIEVVLYGKDIDIITSEEIVNVIEKQVDKIAIEMGIKLTKEEKDIILEQAKLDAVEITNSLSIEDDINNELSKNELETIRFIFSDGLQTILLVLVVIIILIIALLRWSLYRFAVWSGSTMFIAGGVFAIFGIAVNSFVQEQFNHQITKIGLEMLEKNVFEVIINFGLITLVIGAIQVGYYITMKNYKENIKL